MIARRHCNLGIWDSNGPVWALEVRSSCLGRVHGARRVADPYGRGDGQMLLLQRRNRLRLRRRSDR